MYLLRLVLVILSCLCLIYQSNSFMNHLPTPVKLEQIDPLQEEARSCLITLNAPNVKVEELSKAIATVSRATDLSPTLITCMIFTESRFNNKALSSLQYKGYMQTPTATFIYADVDILHGARIFKDKLKITRNNYEDAMFLYKGGKGRARQFAKETLKLYMHLKKNV